MLCKCVGHKKLTKRHSLKKRHISDSSDVYCTVSTGSNQIRHFLFNKPAVKLLVNVSNLTHTSFLLIEQTGSFYKYTTFNPKHDKKVMEMTQLLCKSISPKDSEVRQIRCVTGRKDNTKGYCFAYSWRLAYQIFTGFKDFETHFIYDFINKKRVKEQQIK